MKADSRVPWRSMDQILSDLAYLQWSTTTPHSSIRSEPQGSTAAVRSDEMTKPLLHGGFRVDGHRTARAAVGPSNTFVGVAHRGESVFTLTPSAAVSPCSRRISLFQSRWAASNAMAVKILEFRMRFPILPAEGPPTASPGGGWSAHQWRIGDWCYFGQ